MYMPYNTRNCIDKLLAARVAVRDSCPGSILPTHCVMMTLHKCKSYAIVAELVVKPGAWRLIKCSRCPHRNTLEHSGLDTTNNSIWVNAYETCLKIVRTGYRTCVFGPSFGIVIRTHRFVNSVRVHPQEKSPDFCLIVRFGSVSWKLYSVLGLSLLFNSDLFSKAYVTGHVTWMEDNIRVNLK